MWVRVERGNRKKMKKYQGDAQRTVHGDKTLEASNRRENSVKLKTQTETRVLIPVLHLFLFFPLVGKLLSTPASVQYFGLRLPSEFPNSRANGFKKKKKMHLPIYIPLWPSDLLPPAPGYFENKVMIKSRSFHLSIFK